MQGVNDGRVDNLFEVLCGVDPLVKTRRDELQALFHKIVYEWDKVEDIEFDTINVEIMAELLTYAEEFSGIYSDSGNNIAVIMKALINVPRVAGKRRLL